jgi:spoIIIJ-associated protein
MTQILEFEGKNMDQVLEKASNELNIPVEKLEYDVVSYGSSGIFGLVGAKKAKIRVKKKRAGTVHSDTRSKAVDLVKDAFDLNDEEPAPIETVEETVEDTIQEAIEKSNDKPPVDMDNAIEVGSAAVKRFADFITEGAQVVSEVQDQRLLFKIEGGNSGLLIGKRGQTLEAMQYLAEKIVNKQNQQRVRVLVDVEGYLKTRKINLQKMATKMAEKAKRINKPVTIGQMNAYDRRTVHLHLKSHSAVRTQSVGEGYYRKLVIFPKRRRRRNRNAN